jgi:antagonist of KipI
MSLIEVRAPGLLTTVQDFGREGFGPMGVSASGAADPVALRVGNRLVGNAEGAAGLEMTLIGGSFLFPERTVVALAGSDFGATLDDKCFEMWSSIEVQPGQTLRMGPTRSGARCYLCVRGGIDVKLFLGSASTHLLSGLGGFEGRALRKGDVLKIGSAGGTFRTFRKASVAAKAMAYLAPRKILRVTAGPQSDWFSPESQKAFYTGSYSVAEESNRMGLRLEGAAIAAARSGEMISEGVSLGGVQIPASGLPIILFVEQQTTGGYPKIANVISADLASLGQLKPRDEIRFVPAELETARTLLAEQERWLASKELILA